MCGHDANEFLDFLVRKPSLCWRRRWSQRFGEGKPNKKYKLEILQILRPSKVWHFQTFFSRRLNSILLHSRRELKRLLSVTRTATNMYATIHIFVVEFLPLFKLDNILNRTECICRWIQGANRSQVGFRYASYCYNVVPMILNLIYRDDCMICALQAWHRLYNEGYGGHVSYLNMANLNWRREVRKLTLHFVRIFSIESTIEQEQS